MENIRLRTLKDCLQFFEWLKRDEGMKSSVASELASRYGNYYNHVSLTGTLPVPFSEFLTNVSKFYHKLAKSPTAGKYTGKSSQEITSALFECMPKFLAALYYLLYNVDYKYAAVGGSYWEDLYPGWDAERRGWWGNYPESGGALQQYLRLSISFQLELIPGGFSYGELTYGYDFSAKFAYPRGKNMVGDLERILNKTTHNYFRDVFATSVLVDAGANKVNTANSLALVNLFCEIVAAAEKRNQGGEELKQTLNDHFKPKCINWTELSSHCSMIKMECKKIFRNDGFSYTGQSPVLEALNTREFGKRTAKWLAENLENVRQNVIKINKSFPVDDTTKKPKLAEFVTNHVFPYGFIFGDTSYGTLGKAYKTLTHHWRTVLEMLGKDDDGLDKLRKLLEGEGCEAAKTSRPVAAAKPAPAKPAPEPQPSDGQDAGRQQNNVLHVILSGNGGGGGSSGGTGAGVNLQRTNNHAQSTQQTGPTGVRGPIGPPRPEVTSIPNPEAVNLAVTRAKSAVNGGGHDQGKKSEGAQNQGKKAEGGQGQAGGQIETNSPSSQVAQAAQTQTSSDSRAGSEPPGSPGPSGDQGRGAQAATSGAAQQNVHEAQPVSGDSSMASAGLSAGGAGGGGMEPTIPQTQPPSERNPCSKDRSRMMFGGRTICVPKSETTTSTFHPFHKAISKAWDASKAHYFPPSSPTYSNAQDIQGLRTQDINTPLVHTHQPIANLPSGRQITPQGARWSGKGNNPATHPDYDISRGSYSFYSPDGYAISDLSDATLGGVTMPDTSFEEEEKDRQKRLQAHDERQLFKEKANRQAYVNMQANDLIKSIEEVKKSKDKLMQETINQLLLAEQQKLITTGFDGQPVVDVGYVDGEEIKDDSPHKHEHESKLQFEAYDQATNIQRDRQKQWEQYYQEQNEKINNSEEKHQQEVKRTLDAIKYFKEVEYRRQREAAEAVTGVPLFSKTASNLLESPNYSTISTLPMVTGARIPKSNQLLPIPNGGFDTAMPPHPTIHLEIEKPHDSRIIYGIKEFDNSQTPTNSIEPALPDDTIPNMDPESDTDYSNNIGVFKNYGFTVDPNPNMCNNPWNYADDSATSPTLPPPPDSDHLPPPTNVKAMLFWLVGFNTYGLTAKTERHMEGILKEINSDTLYPKYALAITGDLPTLPASNIADTLTEACLYSAHVLNGIMRMKSNDVLSPIDFKSVYSQLRYSTDPAGLLCQLRDYVYACHHQLAFLKAQCKQGKSHGGWQDCNYGSDVSPTKSPLQSFLTDDWDSTFKTHLFDPSNLCHKSRIRMGFKAKDLPEKLQLGSVISSILTPSCGGEDPLLTLSSYLNCLTRRTPRTTGELVSYFHNFGMELYDFALDSLSQLDSSLTKSHPDCPDWDHLGDSDLQAVRGICGSESLISKHNSSHDKDHPNTLSTLVGCGSDADSCHPHCSPITYRAYALYSQSFAHTYLSWTVYLPDRLHESLQKLYYDLLKHKCSSDKFFHSCSTALPLLYLHGFTPPEVGSQVSLKCSDVIAKLKEIVNGKPIASLMTAMDNFLYTVREPFIFTLVALWSLAFLLFTNTMLYRLDVLRIRSHLIRTKASHRIDVKALLTKGRKMLSLYKDVDYFDEDTLSQFVVQ
ncbi:Chitin_bind_4 domain containing protein [Babesia bigemina]|uniref:Chitin_bind_4 domain containing protein n=1 Tax=Babesia bigemina TaxID=5866 RepID=A0A061D7J7_BABBI|nr:Chitin_bind_4 domain containing protein [Babesia bigemina]CDR94859.1 Chitin_bind_4 domain containing protein [Babesia bigemina]|eukprot:XP_012767045.1 Chitin_bind_4 domain containing protein [Babesia bigemina]